MQEKKKKKSLVKHVGKAEIEQNQASSVMERQRTEAVHSIKEGSVCGQTLEKPGRARFVVPAVKGMPKAQAATAGLEKNGSIQYHLLPRAQRP